MMTQTPRNAWHRPLPLMAALASTLAAAAAENSHTWNAFEADFNALGGAAISNKSDTYRAPSEDQIDLTASYHVTFPQAGSYDLYVRWIPGTFYFSGVFGEAPQWREVKNIKGPEAEYLWMNLSEKLGHPKTGDLTFDVNEPGSRTFMIASRTRGTRIDGFAFGKADETFTDAQLSAAVQNPGAESAGLVGFQAEAAAAYGTDTLTDEAQKLQNAYASQLYQLTKEIQSVLPTVPDAGKTELIASLQNELNPVKALSGLGKTLQQFRAAEDGLLAAQEKLRVAPGELLAAQKKLETALKLPDSDDKAAAVEAAQKLVDSWNRNVDKLPGDVKKRQDFFDKANREMATLVTQIEVATEAGKVARLETRKVLDSLNLDHLLSSGALDTKLAQYTIIAHASPRTLARYAAESPENKANLDQLFSDTPLMLEMLVADGTSGGAYGQAMGIFKAIQGANPKAREGHLRRLALAVSLAHASPTPIEAQADGKEQEQVGRVDPVKRYFSYDKAYRDGELDPAFNDLNVWELTMVVDSNESDEELEWGREMMRSYRPDLMRKDYPDQRYAHMVDQEIQYTSQFVKEDKPELKFMQNLLANGGICGRRAFFGRFVLKAFGIPTVARPEPGHATLAYYTPDDGWQAYLGSQWGSRARVGRYGRDMHFLLNTLAREDESNFTKVKRAQWIGEALGEPAVYGLHGGEEPGFWHAVAIAEQDRIADQVKANKTSRSPGKKEPQPEKIVITDADRQVVVDSSGAITIPAAATKIPEENSAVPGWGPMEIVTFMESNLGGKQLHYSRYGGPQVLEYTFEVPKAGRYEISSRIATTYWGMSLLVYANGNKEVPMPLPFTKGLWENTSPVVIELKAGSNTLTFARAIDMRKGVAIKDFTLSPIK